MLFGMCCAVCVVAILCQVAEQIHWEPTLGFMVWIRERFSGIISSQLAEDTFGFQKKSKYSKGKQKYRRPEKSWGVPIAKNVLSKQHKFEEIPIDGQLDNKSGKLAQSVFQPVKQSQHDAGLLPFNEIAGTNQRPNWYFTDSQNISRGAADIHLGRCVAKRDPSLRVKEFATLQTSWLGHLVDANHKRVFTEGDGAWQFALNHWQDSVCLVWPALRQTFADKAYFQPKLNEGPKFCTSTSWTL